MGDNSTPTCPVCWQPLEEDPETGLLVCPDKDCRFNHTQKETAHAH